ncbi:MAG TPA: hypothetical protein VFC65_10940 [Prolixibacteraceae bacterium]|nr:hypothetical protein [Prolixibacteraceae bacterium]
MNAIDVGNLMIGTGMTKPEVGMKDHEQIVFDGFCLESDIQQLVQTRIDSIPYPLIIYFNNEAFCSCYDG